MALKLTDEQKAYDNMLRQLNNDLTKAYKNLGENSNHYRNLIVLGSSLGLSVHMNKDGIMQYDRNAKQIRETMNGNILGAIKEQYYHHNSKGEVTKDKMKKNLINRQYNVTNQVNEVRKNARKYFSTKTPTTNQMRYMAEKDILVSEFWNRYTDAKDNGTDDDDDPQTIEFHAMQDTAYRIYEGYDITNKPQTAEQFDRLHNLVSQALSESESQLVINVDGFMVDARTGEVIGAIDERTRSVFEQDYFSGDDWTSILE